MKYTSVRQAVSGAGAERVSLFTGIVVRGEPLEVRLAGDEKTVLGEEHIMLPAHITSRRVEGGIERDGEEETDAAFYLDEGPRAGDRLYLLHIPQEGKYIAIGRA